jgi:hypothetical protein
MTNNNGNGNGPGGNGHRSSGHGQPPRGGLNTGTVTVGDKSHPSTGRNSRIEEADFDDEILLERDAELSLGEGDEPATHDLKGEEKRGGPLRRALIGLAAMCVFGLVLVLVAYFWVFGASRKNEMSLQVKTSPESNSKQGTESQGGELTAEEIARALNKPDKPATNTGTSETATPLTGVSPNGGALITDRPPVDAYSTTVDQSLQQQVGTDATRQTGQDTAPGATRGVSTSSTTRAESTSGANIERSIRVNQITEERESANNSRSGQNTARAGTRTSDEKVEDGVAAKSSSVALPPLGTMLPVRTLGTVYTLRTESLVRMQLTRDVGGEGWRLRRGTELYGRMRGADYEVGRAYVALIGFIDPGTNKMVRLEGNVLGGDGTDGLRGKKHKIGGGWSRALRMMGAGAIDALGAVAGTLGRRPVVVGDVYGYGGARAIYPLTAELNGIANGNNRGGFVEVAAGSTGYVLVMQMPRDAQGVDSLTNLPSSELERLADPSVSRTGADLSDEQLAMLITTGTPEQIRASLPRMTPEMRRVAQSMLDSTERER